jgi:N-acetylmuramoyl-L-alanine amidase
VIDQRSPGFRAVKLPLAAAVYTLTMLTSSAQAGQLTTWQMSSDSRRLLFKTNGGVQPKALLLSSPTRLVIDLPATTFPRRTITQKLSGCYSTLRVGQFKGGTTRMVLEMRRGYQLNPRQIRFTGLSSIHWIVDIPIPTR